MVSFLLMLAGWIVFSIAVAKRAEHYNRSFWGWFWLSLVFSPLAGMILVFLLPPLDPDRLPPRWIEERTIESRKRDGAIAVVVAAPIIIVLLFCLAAPFIFH